MATTKTISEALKLIDAKKESLRQAFEDLQSHSSSISSFSLSWSDLDSFFTSQQSSLEHNFHLLESQSQSQPPKPSEEPSSRLALKSICWNMDGLGLRRFISKNPMEHMDGIRAELHDALLYAPDAAKMVLDGMEGFYPHGNNAVQLRELRDIRRSCLVMLEGLIGVKTAIKPEVRERARKLALEWKSKFNGSNKLMALGFLNLLGAFGLGDGFNMDELIDIVISVAKHRQAVKLCRLIDFGDNISELIKKLISSGRQLLAIKFIFEFELTDKFPAEPLVENYLRKFRVPQVHTGEKNTPEYLNPARRKKLNELKSIMKYVKDAKFTSGYLKENVANLIEKLDMEKETENEARKRSAVAPPVAKPGKQLKIQKKTGKKALLRTTAKTGPVTNKNSPHQPPSGKLVDRPDRYPSFPGGPQGLRGSTPATGASYGLVPAGAQYGFAPSGAPYGSTPTATPRGPTPAGAPHGPVPAGAPHSSTPVGAPHSSTPAGAPYRPTPAVAPYVPAPAGATYGSAPAVAPYVPAPAGAPYGSAPAVAPYVPAHPDSSHAGGPYGVARPTGGFSGNTQTALGFHHRT